MMQKKKIAPLAFYSFTKAELQAFVDEATEISLEDEIVVQQILLATVLNQEFGFGQKRLDAVFQAINTEYAKLEKDPVRKIKEMDKELKRKHFNIRSYKLFENGERRVSKNLLERLDD